MLISILRTFKFAFVNFWRNFWLSVVTISIIVLSLLSANFFIFTNALVDTSIEAVEERINVTVQFKTTAQESEVLDLKKILEDREEVREVQYISKQAALETLRDKYRTQENIPITEALDELETNPLSPSLLVKTNEVEQYPSVIKYLEQTRFEELIEKKNFNDRRLLIEKISGLKGRVGQIGIAINVFFLIIAALIVFNTIRITIYTRKEEIGVMKLVGASNWFIRAPLVLESIIYSFIAIAITIMIIYPLLGVAQPYADKMFDGQAFDVLGFFSANFVTIFGYQLLASIALNVVSSGLAIGRYLKV